MRTTAALADELARAVRPGDDLPRLAATTYAVVARHVPFAFACLATTDPASGVITWASKSGPLDVGDEEFAAVEYGPPDLNKFEEIARRRPPVGALGLDTGGRPDLCRRHREYMQPRFGFTDELRAVLASRSASWGALALYRGEGEPAFTADDVEQVARICTPLAEAVQRSLFRTSPGAPSPDAADLGPAVLIIDAKERLSHVTPAARAAIDRLGGFDHGDLPATMCSVVAATRTRGEPFESRCRAQDGTWLSLRAAPLSGGEDGTDVVMTVEPTPRATLSRLALAAHGLTTREEEVAALVLQGVNTRGIAESLHLSPHTVQDHLKSVFAKLGVSSRREMTAALVLR